MATVLRSDWQPMLVETESEYDRFLLDKLRKQPPTGIAEVGPIHELLYPFQVAITRWALERGRAAIFADCGLGKSLMQLEWAKHVHEFTGKPVLIFAPLAVAKQTQREGKKIGVEVTHVHEPSEIAPGVNVTNYERLHKFEDSSIFGGIVLDESSILKGYDRKYATTLIEFGAEIPFRLCCTATPAPNDQMELGTHSEFLGVMTRAEMLAMYFIHDGGSTQNWRLKGHAKRDFWRWLASWAVALRKPSDLGYKDGGFDLPPLNITDEVIPMTGQNGYLFPVESQSLDERRQARKSSLQKRVSKVAEMVNGSSDQWLVWCDLNAESEALAKAIPDAVEVKGSDSEEHKENAFTGFADGSIRVLVTKPSIAGFGLNWQSCHNMAFTGLSDSYEQYYQAIRRCWRFGQKNPVNVTVVISEIEGNVRANIMRKEEQASEMMDELVTHMGEEGWNTQYRTKKDYEIKKESSDRWTLYNGDCVDVLRYLDSDSLHYSIFSPPFASLYTYSDSERDMGNCQGTEDFARHFGFMVSELFRCMMPGRLVSFHCMNVPAMKARDGFIGIKDFRGQLISIFQEAGFYYHSEVCIWKDPVTQMQRTKAVGLLHKQLKKDSAMCRQGIADYLVTMRKPGDNPERVEHTDESFPVRLWQKYASPVWMDINPNKTLQFRNARENDDERHICPLQLQVIERGIDLWTNPNDLVFSPFAGIGSEGYQAIIQGRRFIGSELKESYFNCAVKNLLAAEEEEKHSQHDLFSLNPAMREVAS